MKNKRPGTYCYRCGQRILNGRDYAVWVEYNMGKRYLVPAAITHIVCPNEPLENA